MNWRIFQTYNEGEPRAFEAMCNQLFELWINRTYKEFLQSFVVVNGSGGDGGVEAYAKLTDGSEIGVQAKWFLKTITDKQFNQIKESILTAIKVHSKLKTYIICVPNDLTNAKIGNNGEIVQNTEYSKWQKIKTDIGEKYPNVELILWNDHRLTGELQYSEAAGVKRYWFEKEELTKDAVERSFKKQKSGWLDQRYISDLHNQGTIHKEIMSFLGNSKECDGLLEELENIEKDYRMLITQSGVLCELLHEKSLFNEETEELKELCKKVESQCEELNEIKNAFRFECRLNPWEEWVLTYEKLESVKKWLDNNIFGAYHNHFRDVRKLLKKICNVNMVQLFDKLKQRCNFEKMIVVGDPGTGKTHGIANVVETQLKQHYHIPILIQAKSVEPQEEWREIIIHALGLSQIWEEDELLSALEALSYRNETNNPMSDKDNEIRIIPKVIICIDGIDEIWPYERWHERIGQVREIVSSHQRIRFCFTGREYAFEWKRVLQDKNLKKVNLSSDGDVPVRKIYDDYIKFYNVNDNGVKWLRNAISTPYALKLVCELYREKHIGKIEKSDVTVTKLLEEKFEKLDQEFKMREGFRENTHDQIVKNVLIEIYKLFETEFQNKVTWTEIKKTLRKLDIYSYLSESGLEKIVNFLEKHAFLRSYRKKAESIFENDEIIYYLGLQPAYDYIKALQFFEKSIYSDDLELDSRILTNRGALQMYAVMVMDKYGRILWDNKSCHEHLDEEDLFSLVAYAVVNANISVKYAQWIKKVMKGNATALFWVVNKIVFPLAREEKHPLGSKILDQCLSEFDKPADRDVIWSIPSGLKGNDDSIWIRYDDIEYINESYKLDETDCYDGMPLVWAWGLTSVDNGQRTMIRKEVTKWGIIKPEEFFKLFEHFVDINDIQAKTDIFSIAMAVTYVCRKNHDFLKLISKWIYKNVFSDNKIKNINNAAIRYYSRAIMECALSEGVISDEKIEMCRPPYNADASLLPFSVEAIEGTRMEGYKTMDYNVSRYILCEPLDEKFFKNRDNNEKIEEILNKFCREYHLPSLSSEEWVLGCAFGQVKAAGWREDVFYGKPNGGQIGEKLGLDIAICRQFGHAAQGSMNRIITIAEKYSRCAKMELLGYLADRLYFSDNEKKDEYIKDYGQLEEYVNPYQELCQIDVDTVMEETDLLLPEELSPCIDGCDDTPDGIEKWINNSYLPNFERWINIQHGEITLFASHSISNELQGITTYMWISSGLISKGSISSLVKKIKESDFAVELIRADTIFSYPASDCYISPLEVCWFDWKNENNSCIKYGNTTIYKNVAKCTCDILGKGEIYYAIPSKKVREIMEIISGDGYHYYNKDGIEVASYREAGEYFSNNQHILTVNSDVYNSKVSERGLQPIWIIRVLNEISSKARERFNCFMDKDETYLVWKNSKSWQVRKLERPE